MTLPTAILPSWRYHAKHPAMLIETQAELDEAEVEGWADSPAAAWPSIDIDGTMERAVIAESL